MPTKPVQQVLPPPPPHMVGDGFRVHNFFPSGYNMGMYRMSPFFLMDYGSKYVFPPSDKPRGVGVHPHRGFETVTIAYHGRVAHHDSYGNSGVIGEGDVQWMTAASGILHKEYHDTEYSKKGGPFQMVQLWVNLPAKDKMSTPKYQPVAKDKMGRYEIPDDGGTVEVIAGECKGVKGPAQTFTPMHVFNVRLKRDKQVTLEFPSNYNTGILIVEGSVNVNESHTAPLDNFVLFKNEGESFNIKAIEDSVILVLSGEPIQETIVAQGPFLMNTRQQILEAIDDYQNGKFGHLEE
jgi:quercetin 2,3-dioxygenase